MGNEDDKEAAVLIEKLVKWYRFILIFVIVLGLLLISTLGSSESFILYPLIFLGVGATLNLLTYRKMLCPFCRKPVLWKPHPSGIWFFGTCTAILPKKCPQCSRDLRVKKKKKAEAARIQK